MEMSNPHNQSYWFVLREDQSNVIFSSNFALQNQISVAGHDARYVIDSGEKQYIQINEAPIVLQEAVQEEIEKETPKRDTDNFWDRSKIKYLLALCLKNKLKNQKDKNFWTELAAQIGTTPDECIKKYRNLRRTYIRLLKKKRSGKEIKWVHYNVCEEVFNECKSLPAAVLEPWEDHKVRRLLNLYIENLHRFKNPDGLQKDVWKDIALQLGTTQYNCYHKFKNLKRAYFNWLERSQQTGKPMKWQYYQYFERIFANHQPTVGPWNRNKTKTLIDSYIQLADKFKNPKFQKKELWKDISEIVGESPTDCDKKFRNLKQTYIRLKMKADMGRAITKWRYYQDFEIIYSTQRNYEMSEQSCTNQHVSEENYVRKLLTFYIENKEKFRDPLIKKKNVWRLLAPKIGLYPEECDRKFRNLKQTYIRLAEKKRETGKSSNWPYFSYFEKIFDEPTALYSSNQVNVDDNMTYSEIKRIVMQEMQAKKDTDRFECLVRAVEESNNIQRERNRILQALLDRR